MVVCSYWWVGGYLSGCLTASRGRSEVERPLRAKARVVPCRARILQTEGRLGVICSRRPGGAWAPRGSLCMASLSAVWGHACGSPFQAPDSGPLSFTIGMQVCSELVRFPSGSHSKWVAVFSAKSGFRRSARARTSSPLAFGSPSQSGHVLKSWARPPTWAVCPC